LPGPQNEVARAGPGVAMPLLASQTLSVPFSMEPIHVLWNGKGLAYETTEVCRAA